MNRDELYHYGVKGMKWKHHKYANKIGDKYIYGLRGEGNYLRAKAKYAMNKGAHGIDPSSMRRIRTRNNIKRTINNARNTGESAGLSYFSDKRSATAKLKRRRKQYAKIAERELSRAKRYGNRTIRSAKRTYIHSAPGRSNSASRNLVKYGPKRYAEGYQRMRQNKKRAANY